MGAIKTRFCEAGGGGQAGEVLKENAEAFGIVVGRIGLKVVLLNATLWPKIITTGGKHQHGMVKLPAGFKRPPYGGHGVHPAVRLCPKVRDSNFGGTPGALNCHEG